jgi:hypothetical protein
MIINRLSGLVAGIALGSVLFAIAQGALVSVAQPPADGDLADESESSVCKALADTDSACKPGGAFDKIISGIDRLLEPSRDAGGVAKDTPVNTASDKAEEGYPKVIPQTPEEEAEARAIEAAARDEAQRAARARIEVTNSELVKIKVEDASALALLNEFCADNARPSGACMQQVSRAQNVARRMAELLAKPGVETYLAGTLKDTWRPQSPLRASSVIMPDLNPPGRDCREVIVRFMRFDATNLSAASQAAVDTVEKGWSEAMVYPAVVSSNSPQDIRAALIMTDERIAREKPGPGGLAQYDYVKCIYQRRLDQLEGGSQAALSVTPPAVDPFSVRRGVTDGSRMIGDATDDSQRPERLSQAQAEMSDLVRKSQDIEANALLNTLTGGLAIYDAVVAAVEGQSLLEQQQYALNVPAMPQIVPGATPPPASFPTSPNNRPIQPVTPPVGSTPVVPADDYLTRQKAMTDAMNQQAQQNAAAQAQASLQSQVRVASECVGYQAGSGGTFGGLAQLTNSCGFALEVQFCYSTAERGSWAEGTLECGRNQTGLTSIGARSRTGISSGGPNSSVLWAACPSPTTPSGWRPGGTYNCR